MIPWTTKHTLVSPRFLRRLHSNTWHSFVCLHSTTGCGRLLKRTGSNVKDPSSSHTARALTARPSVFHRQNAPKVTRPLPSFFHDRSVHFSTNTRNTTLPADSSISPFYVLPRLRPMWFWHISTTALVNTPAQGPTDHGNRESVTDRRVFTSVCATGLRSWVVPLTDSSVLTAIPLATGTL